MTPHLRHRSAPVSGPPSHQPVPCPRRRWLLSAALLAAAFAVFALGACGGSGKNDEGAKASATAGSGAVSGGGGVDIVNFEFKPQKLTVKAGTKVTWTNQDTALHAVKDTSPLATPASKDMAKGDTFSITYDRPGSYSYICGIHNYMTGSVEVTG